MGRVMLWTVELFNQWRFTSSRKCQKVLWKLSLFAGCWKIWHERNNQVFNSKSSCETYILDSIVWIVSSWVSRDKVFKDVFVYDLNRSWEVYFREDSYLKHVL